MISTDNSEGGRFQQGIIAHYVNAKIRGKRYRYLKCINGTEILDLVSGLMVCAFNIDKICIIYVQFNRSCL